MTLTVSGPDGSTFDFPDGTDTDTISSAMDQHYGGTPTGASSNTTSDSEANKGYMEAGLDALRYGAGNMVQGLASTSKVLGGPDYTNEVAGLGTNGGTYTPASTGLFDKSKGWMERLGFLPRFLTEQVPQIGGMVAADALTGGIGGPLLIGGTTLGPGVQEAAQASGNDPNNPSTMDYVRGIGNAGVQAGLAKIGFGGASGAIGSTADTALAKAAGIAKAAGTGALAVGAGDLANKGIIEGQLPSVDELATSALAGGVGAGALRGAGELVPSRPTLKFADIDSANGANLAEHFNGLDTSTPKDAFQSVNTVEGKLQNLIKTEPDTQAQLNYLEKQPGYNADIRQKLNGVRDQLKDGKVVDPQAINDIGDALRPIAPVGNEPSGMVARQSDKLVQALQDYNSLNKVKAAGNYDPQAQTFGNKVTGLGALANSPALTPRWNPYHMGLEGMALHYLTGMAGIPSVAVAAGLPLSQMAIRAGVRGLDSATGMRSNPLDQFTSRFGQGSNDSALPRGDVTSAALASNSVPLGPVDTSVTDATSSVDSLLHPQQQPASRRQTATQQPQAPAPAQPKASPETPVVNFRDVLEQRNLLAKAQALSDKQQAKANTLVDNGVGSIARANALQAAQEPVAAPVTQEAASGRNTPIEGDTISTSKDGHTVVADANSVAKQAAWAAAVRKRIGVRSDVMNEAEALVDHDPQALPQLAQIRSDLSAQSLPSQEAARQMIDKHLAKMKPHHRAAVRHLLHSPRMMSTFKP